MNTENGKKVIAPALDESNPTPGTSGFFEKKADAEATITVENTAPAADKVEELSQQFQSSIAGFEAMGDFFANIAVHQAEKERLEAEADKAKNIVDNKLQTVEFVEKDGFIGLETAAVTPVKEAPADLGLIFDMSALDKKVADEKALEAELAASINRAKEKTERDSQDKIAEEKFMDASGNEELKRKKAILIGHLDALKLTADMSAVNVNVHNKGRVSNLVNGVKSFFGTMKDVVLPADYIMAREEQKNHLNFANEQKAIARQKLVDQVYSINDRYDTIIEYVKNGAVGFENLDVNDGAAVEKFIADCRVNRNSVHYGLVAERSLAKVADEVKNYNETLAATDKIVSEDKYKLETEQLDAKMKNYSGLFGRMTSAISSAWKKVAGESKPETPWTKIRIPTIYRKEVTFQVNQEAVINSPKVADKAALDRSNAAKESGNKKTGFGLGLAAAAALLAGVVLLGKDTKNTAIITPEPSSEDGAKPAPVAVAALAPTVKVEEPTPAPTVTENKTVPTPVQTAPKPVQTPVKAKTVLKSTTIEKPLVVEKKEPKVEVASKAITHAEKMRERAFVMKKVELYKVLMAEIGEPVVENIPAAYVDVGTIPADAKAKAVPANKKYAAYNPDFNPLLETLDKILAQAKTLETRDDVLALHALTSHADNLMGKYQSQRNSIATAKPLEQASINIATDESLIKNVTQLLAGRSRKFTIHIPKGKKDDVSQLSQVVTIDLDSIEAAVKYLHAKAYAPSIPTPEMAKWMVDASEHHMKTLKFAEWYLAKEPKNVQF